MTKAALDGTHDSAIQSGRDPRPSEAFVAAIIVTYHPDPDLYNRVLPLVGQVKAIVIVDNGSTEAELAPVVALELDGIVETIRNGKNLGVATALNQGFAWVEERGYAWALTLDQDTTPGPDVVSEAARVFDEFPTPRPAVIGAAHEIWKDGSPDDARVGRPAACVITAGALHSVFLWRSIGGFCDDLFIDLVDTEFCLRARAFGLAIVRSNTPTISHEIGRPTRRRTRLRSFTASNHNRTRRYYITRNRIIVWRTYALREPSYVWFDMKACAKELVKVAIVEDDRWGKMAAVVRGAFDGLRGRTGPIAAKSGTVRGESPGMPTAGASDGTRVRVLLLLHELTVTGAARLALGVFRALGDDIELAMVARDGGPLEAAFRELGGLSNLRDAQAKSTRSLIARRFGYSADRTVGRRVRAWRPDVIYVNSVQALTLVRRLDLRGTPVVLHVHELTVALEGYERHNPGLIREIPERYIAVSSAVAHELIGRYQVTRENVTVIPPFVEIPAPFQGGPVIVNARGSGGPFVVGGIGNPSWTKGLSLWLLAAREIADRLGPDAVRFVWVGVRENEEGLRFRAMAHKLRMDDLVEFVPETTDPGGHLARFDVLAMSSWEESASMAVLEAMANGIPAVCFADSGGPAEEVADGGVVVADFSPLDMAKAIIGLIEDPDRRAQLGSAARNRVIASYSREAIVPRIAAEIAAAGIR